MLSVVACVISKNTVDFLTSKYLPCTVIVSPIPAVVGVVPVIMIGLFPWDINDNIWPSFSTEFTIS